ncbi:ABC transporter substrate-binding protein [Acidisoma cellulosilytica]|uniref:ABC transporter substrate-binding protein n=1 Tax=Acidisoma cellulosilyticum TaxID=2802395 RepID=A0A964E4N6_9PROT|nr:ABC transporter substrate-binding protein [Acidisoma cellulosilyticum]MCB8881163.1 ABC transporter substrate-binding protein [Acidisoma cellulosilyticum]
MRRNWQSLVAKMVFSGCVTAMMAAPVAAQAQSHCVTGTRKPPFSIGWANIYSVPTWMKQTTDTINSEAAELKKQGLVSKLMITDAQGSANTQIQQIQSMIDANMDAILVDAGSATALDRVISAACAKGIAVISFDSLVDSDDLTAKIIIDSKEWGRDAATWMAKTLDGKGNILVLNGPAGVSVSEDRRAGAMEVLKQYPGIKILAETNTPYNSAPAQEAVTNLLFSQPKIDGVLSLGGALSAGALLAFERQGRAPVPMTGENYRQFLELWKKTGIKGWAAMQPNWLGAMAAYVAVQALDGKPVPVHVNVPLPVITDATLPSYLARAKDFPTDGYIYSPYSQALFASYLAQK